MANYSICVIIVCAFINIGMLQSTSTICLYIQAIYTQSIGNNSKVTSTDASCWEASL